MKSVDMEMAAAASGRRRVGVGRWNDEEQEDGEEKSKRREKTECRKCVRTR